MESVKLTLTLVCLSFCCVIAATESNSSWITVVMSKNLSTTPQTRDPKLEGSDKPQPRDSKLEGPDKPQPRDSKLEGPDKPQPRDSKLEGPDKPQPRDSKLEGPDKPQPRDPKLEGSDKPQPKDLSPIMMSKEANSTNIDPKELVPKQALSVCPCGPHELIPGESVTIQTKNYPQNYPSPSKCIWKFKGTSSDSTISITCQDFHLRKCGQSKVLITGANLDDKFCKDKSPLTLPSSRNSMKIKFIAKTSKSNTGFSCTVSASDVDSTTTSTTSSTSSTTSTTSSTSTTSTPTSCKCGRTNPITRIVGGNPTTVHEYPWQVALTSSGSNRPYCGGSIICDQWILTAAHCISSTTESDVVVIGEHQYTTTSETSVTERRMISQVVVHSGYNSNTLDNDMALIKLSSPITFPQDNKIAPVCLPPAGNPYEDVHAIVTGWGTLSSGGSQPNQLYEVTVPTMTNSKCNGLIGGITANMICAGLDAGGKDSCQGDSGGPMVTSGNTAGDYMIQIGVVSWGYGCAVRDQPGVYARVNNYLSWIASTTQGCNYCSPP